MKSAWIWAAMALLPVSMAAQSALPAGTILPVSLHRAINAAKARNGQLIQARVMQNIPGTSIHRGARVLGHIVAVTSQKNGPSRLDIVFDSIEDHGRSIPLHAHLRAVASYLEVAQAQIPEEEASRGINPENATTQQIGGEMVYRGGGHVESGVQIVGEPTPYGVRALPRAQRGQSCRGVDGNNSKPQAFWLFSTDACGVYGYSNLRIVHAGRTTPQGRIVLEAKRGKLALDGGSGLLLRVAGS